MFNGTPTQKLSGYNSAIHPELENQLLLGNVGNIFSYYVVFNEDLVCFLFGLIFVNCEEGMSILRTYNYGKRNTILMTVAI